MDEHNNSAEPEEDILNVTEDQPLLEVRNEGVNTKNIFPSISALLWFTTYIKVYWQLAKKSVIQNSYSSILIVAITIFIVIYTILVLVFISDKVFQDSVAVNIFNVTIDEVFNEGLGLTVDGSIALDYGCVSWWYKLIFIPFTFSLGVLNLSLNKPVDYFVNLPESTLPKEYYNPIKVEIGDVWINLRSGSVNSFQLPVKAFVDPFDMTRLFGQYSYLIDGLGIDTFYVNIVLKASIKAHKSSIPLGDYNVNVSRRLKVASNQVLAPKYDLRVYDINPGSSSITADVYIIVSDIGIPIDIALPKIDWDVFIQGCSGTIARVGSFQTDSVAFHRFEELSIHLTIDVPKLSSRLTKLCQDGLSPVNRFVNSATNDGTARIFVKSKALSDNNKRLPKWLHLILSNNLQQFQVNTSNYVGGSAGLNASLSGITATLPNDENKLPSFDTQVHLTLDDVPKGYNAQNGFVNIKEITGRLSFSHDGEDAFKIYLDHWQKTLTNDTSISLSIKGAKLDILDDSLAADLINTYLGGESFNVTVESVLDLAVSTPILKSVFQGIEKSFELPISPIGGLMEGLDLGLSELLYASTSTDSQLETITQVSLGNPYPFGANLQFLDLNILYNDTNVGSLQFSDASVEKNSTSTLTPILKLNKHTDAAKIALQDMISDYISSKDPEILVQGHDNSTKSLAVAKTLSHISVPFKIPTFQATDSELQGFIIGCTIHLLTSNVEVTVYNPFKNQVVEVNIKEAIVTHNDVEIAYINDPPVLMLPPGISTTPRIPITYPQGLSKDILRKAINGDLDVKTVAQFNLVVNKFSLDLFYEGKGLAAKIRW